MMKICKLTAVALSLCLSSSALAYDMFSNSPPSSPQPSTMSSKSPAYFAQQIRQDMKAKNEAAQKAKEQNAERYQRKAEENRQAYLDNRPAPISSTTQTYTPATAEQQRSLRTHPYYQQQPQQPQQQTQQATQEQQTEPAPIESSNPYSVGNFGTPKPQNTGTKNSNSGGSWGISY